MLKHLNLLGFCHIGFAVNDVDSFQRTWGAALGIERWHIHEESASGGIQLHGRDVGELRVRVAFARVGGTSLELIETQVGSTHHREHVDSRGAGLHHIAFWVHDLATELAKIDRLGLELVMSPSSLHPALRGRPVSAFLGVGRGSVAIPEFFAFLDSVEETAHFGLELLDAKFAADYRALNGDAPFYPGELP